jgi:hypothetical protein
MKSRVFYCVLAVLAVVLSGCGKRAGTGSQATPREALDTFFDSIVELDKSKYMSVLSGTRAQLEAASVFMDYVIAVSAFKKAVIKKYGASGWSHFENEGGATLSMDLAANRDKLDSARIEVTADKASCTVPGEAQVLHFSRKNGVWYVEAGMFVNTGGVDSRKFISMWKQMAELIKKKQKRIGQAGVTAESLDMELGAEMISILLGT